MPENLTESLEDYIDAIAELTAVEGHAHSKEIAAKLHVKHIIINKRQIENEKLWKSIA